MIIAHSKPTITSADAKKVADVIKSGYIAQGKKVSEFERKFSRYQKVKYALAVNSGTSALHLSLLALGVQKGDNVIIPTLVCTALMNAVKYTGASVRIVDVDRDDFNISVQKVKKRIDKKTKAIIVPHMFGMAADIKSLLSLKVPVIEDCAHSIGATYQKKPVGSFGILSIYSFYATKMMTTGEGGMVTSRNVQLINRMRDLRDYDQKHDYKTRYNFKMTDMQAALGIGQLSKLPKWIKRRRTIAKMYHQAFKGCGFELPLEKDRRKHVYFRYVIRVKKGKQKLMKKLKSKGIQCASPVYKPLHNYLQLRGCGCADQIMKESISLPIYPLLSNDQVKYIIRHVKTVV